MTLLTQPLRDEHKELLPHVEEIRSVANLVGDAPVSALRQQIDETYDFLARHLIPHAKAEDKALYSIVGKSIGTSEAMAPMQFDHVEIGRMTQRLGTLRTQFSGTALKDAQIKELREVLYGLYVLVRTHFVKEEEIYLPILDAKLTSEEAHQMFDAMEAAAAEAKKQLGH